MRFQFITLLGSLILTMVAPGQAAAGWLVGGSLAVSVTDSPISTNFSEQVTLTPGTSTLDAGEMTLTQSIVPAGGNSQWLVLDFEATDGRLLAGNRFGYWEIGGHAPVTAPSYLTSAFVYWSVNGVATNPIYPFSGLSQIEANPINPELGPVYYENLQSQPALLLGASVHSSPYYGISDGGMNPSAVTGFTIAFLETNAVPEPSTFCLAAISAVMVGVASLVWRRCR